MTEQVPRTQAASCIENRSGHAAFLVGGVILLCAAAASAAQLDEAQRLLDEQRARQREEQMRQLRPSIKREGPTASEFDVRTDPASVSEVEPAFDIRRIVIKGDVLLDAGERDAILRPFTGLRLGEKRINLLLRRLTAALIDRGYVTSRAYIAPQDLASGVLEVTLVAGRIEAVRVDGRAAGGGDWAPLPFRTDEVLRLADLEQGADQVNRLRSSRAEMQILPGQSPGGSIVDIRTHVREPWGLHLGADNYGQDSTGILRGRVMIEADNPLGVFDAWNLTHIQSGDSKASLLSVSVPWGYSTLSYRRRGYRARLQGRRALRRPWCLYAPRAALDRCCCAPVGGRPLCVPRPWPRAPDGRPQLEPPRRLRPRRPPHVEGDQRRSQLGPARFGTRVGAAAHPAAPHPQLPILMPIR